MWAMIRENRQLVANDPVAFEKESVEVQDCRKFSNHFRGIYRVYTNLIRENQRMSTCNPLDLKHQDLNGLCPKISPITASGTISAWCC